MKKYYFAYGSNLDINRLQSRIGKVVNLGRSFLRGWTLVFNAGANMQCYANIIFTGNHLDVVEGVVYQLSARQIKILDGYEGAPGLYTRMIERYKGKDLQVYVSINPQYTQQQVKNILPSLEYLGYMMRGCEANGLVRTRKLCQDQMGARVLE